MPRRTYTVNGELFTTQTALKKRCQQILYAYPHSTAVSDEDRQFLISLVSNYHPQANEKIGCGVERIEPRRNPEFPSSTGFFIVRKDGTVAEFSFYECLRETTLRGKYKTACRNAVADTVFIFAMNFWSQQNRPAICQLTGGPMTPDSSHVHHAGYWDFDRIANGFLSENGIDMESIILRSTGDGVIGDHFADEKLKQSFIDYHNARAVLEVVSIKGNLSTAKKK